MNQKRKPLRIALIGNPNTGKSTLFNQLTGARERTGNWTGVTVDHAETRIPLPQGREARLVDLPGIYSLSTYSPDEEAAKNNLLKHPPDLILNVLDASNLERSFYLTSQLIELDTPIVLALNQIDVAQRLGITIDAAHLSHHLGVPVIPISAVHGQGIETLRQALLAAADQRPLPLSRPEYDPLIEAGIKTLLADPDLTQTLAPHGATPRYWALKLLERDHQAMTLTHGRCHETIQRTELTLARHARHTILDAVMDARRGFARGLLRHTVTQAPEKHQRLSDRIDRILLNQAIGIPLFLLVILLLFLITTTFAQPLVALIDTLLSNLLVHGASHLLHTLLAPQWLTRLLSDGIGGGITAVLTFAPPIFLIFFCLSLLEESGYMARAVFVMDRTLRRIGLPGKAFIPLLVGFGCSVPALMATRTLEHRRDRILTMLLTPFMSCGARLPVYTLFAIAFFPRHTGLIVFSLYATGILTALLSGLLFSRTLLKGNTTDFVMELPPYHLPVIRGCAQHAWAHFKSFVYRAGQIIITLSAAASLIAHFLATPQKASSPPSGHTPLTALFAPIGITPDNWQAPLALGAGLMAKEVVIGALSVLYLGAPADETQPQPFSLRQTLCDTGTAFLDALPFTASPQPPPDHPQQTLHQALRNHFHTPASAYAYLLFVLLYAPCTAALAVFAREIGWPWALFMLTYTTAAAYLIATLFYQISRLLT